MVPFLKGVQCTERARCVGPHRHRVPRPHIVLPHERRTSNTGYTGHRSRDSALQAPLRVHTREGRLSSLYCVRATTYRKPATGFLVGSSFAAAARSRRLLKGLLTPVVRLHAHHQKHNSPSTSSCQAGLALARRPTSAAGQRPHACRHALSRSRGGARAAVEK